MERLEHMQRQLMGTYDELRVAKAKLAEKLLSAQSRFGEEGAMDLIKGSHGHLQPVPEDDGASSGHTSAAPTWSDAGNIETADGNPGAPFPQDVSLKSLASPHSPEGAKDVVVRARFEMCQQQLMRTQAKLVEQDMQLTRSPGQRTSNELAAPVSRETAELLALLDERNRRIMELEALLSERKNGDPRQPVQPFQQLNGLAAKGMTILPDSPAKYPTEGAGPLPASPMESEVTREGKSASEDGSEDITKLCDTPSLMGSPNVSHSASGSGSCVVGMTTPSCAAPPSRPQAKQKGRTKVPLLPLGDLAPRVRGESNTTTAPERVHGDSGITIATETTPNSLGNSKGKVESTVRACSVKQQLEELEEIVVQVTGGSVQPANASAPSIRAAPTSPLGCAAAVATPPAGGLPRAASPVQSSVIRAVTPILVRPSGSVASCSRSLTPQRFTSAPSKRRDQSPQRLASAPQPQQQLRQQWQNQHPQQSCPFACVSPLLQLEEPATEALAGPPPVFDHSSSSQCLMHAGCLPNRTMGRTQSAPHLRNAAVKPSGCQLGGVPAVAGGCIGTPGVIVPDMSLTTNCWAYRGQGAPPVPCAGGGVLAGTTPMFPGAHLHESVGRAQAHDSRGRSPSLERRSSGRQASSSAVWPVSSPGLGGVGEARNSLMALHRPSLGHGPPMQRFPSRPMVAAPPPPTRWYQQAQ